MHREQLIYQAKVRVSEPLRKVELPCVLGI